MAAVELERKKYFILSLEREGKLKLGMAGRIAYLQRTQKTDIQETSLSKLSRLLGAVSMTNRHTTYVIIIHAHGMTPNQEDGYQQKICIDNKQPITTNTAKEFAKFLVTKKVLTGIKELHLLACYTDKFAEGLARELAMVGYKNLKIVGYEGELSVCQGVDGDMIAGFSPIVTPKFYDADGHLNFAVLSDQIKIQHSAKNFEYSYNTASFLSHLKGSQKEGIAELSGKLAALSISQASRSILGEKQKVEQSKLPTGSSQRYSIRQSQVAQQAATLSAASSSSSSATAAAGTSKKDEKTMSNKPISGQTATFTSPANTSSSTAPTTMPAASTAVVPRQMSQGDSFSATISALSNSSQSGSTVSVSAATGLVASSSSSLPQYNSSTSNSSTSTAISSSTTPNVSASTAETPESTQNPPKNPNNHKL